MKKIRELQWLTGTKYLMESIDDYNWAGFLANYKEDLSLVTINDIPYDKKLDTASSNFGTRHLSLLFELKGISLTIKNEAILKDITINGEPFASYDFELSKLIDNLNKYFVYFNNQSGTKSLLIVGKQKFMFNSFFDLPKNKFIEFTLWYLDSIEDKIKELDLVEVDFNNYVNSLINFSKELTESITKLPIDEKSKILINGTQVISTIISKGTEYTKLFKNAELYKASLNKELLDAEYIKKQLSK